MPALMLVLALVPVLVGANAKGISRPARAMPPALAARLLTACALSVSLVTGMLLCLVAYLGTVAMLPQVHPVDWYAPYLRHALPIPGPVAIASGLLAAGLMLRAVVHLVRVVVRARRTGAATAALPEVAGLTVVDDEAVHAYAVPGRDPRIVVSTGLLRRLDGPQRRALLAHEQAHLRHRHHLYVQLARLAVAANPLVRPVSRAVDAAVERWADAEAAREVADPAIVAQALGIAALARPAGLSGSSLGAAQGDVVERVRELLEPSRRRRVVSLRLLLITAACWACWVTVIAYVHGVVELAEIVYWSAH